MYDALKVFMIVYMLGAPFAFVLCFARFTLLSG